MNLAITNTLLSEFIGLLRQLFFLGRRSLHLGNAATFRRQYVRSVPACPFPLLQPASSWLQRYGGKNVECKFSALPVHYRNWVIQMALFKDRIELPHGGGVDGDDAALGAGAQGRPTGPGLAAVGGVDAGRLSHTVGVGGHDDGAVVQADTRARAGAKEALILDAQPGIE